MAVDFLGQELNVGDDIVFVEKNYRQFKKGKIIKITAKMLETDTHFRQFHNQVIKINIPSKDEFYSNN